MGNAQTAQRCSYDVENAKSAFAIIIRMGELRPQLSECTKRLTEFQYPPGFETNESSDELVSFKHCQKTLSVSTRDLFLKLGQFEQEQKKLTSLTSETRKYDAGSISKALQQLCKWILDNQSIKKRLENVKKAKVTCTNFQHFVETKIKNSLISAGSNQNTDQVRIWKEVARNFKETLNQFESLLETLPRLPEAAKQVNFLSPELTDMFAEQLNMYSSQNNDGKLPLSQFERDAKAISQMKTGYVQLGHDCAIVSENCQTTTKTLSKYKSLEIECSAVSKNSKNLTDALLPRAVDHKKVNQQVKAYQRNPTRKSLLLLIEKLQALREKYCHFSTIVYSTRDGIASLGEAANQVVRKCDPNTGENSPNESLLASLVKSFVASFRRTRLVSRFLGPVDERMSVITETLTNSGLNKIEELATKVGCTCESITEILERYRDRLKLHPVCEVTQ